MRQTINKEFLYFMHRINGDIWNNYTTGKLIYKYVENILVNYSDVSLIMLVLSSSDWDEKLGNIIMLINSPSTL